jgi:linoleoyl-CoA desaturase
MVACLDAPLRLRFPEHGAFSRELKARADSYFDGHADRRRDIPRMYLKTTFILTWFVGSWAILAFTERPWWQAMMLAVSIGLSIAAIGMSVQHDANHGAYSRHAWVNRALGSTLDVMGVNSFIWRHKHNVLHHTYTNVEGIDYDLDFGWLARLSPGQQRRAWHRYQQFYLWFFYGFLLPKWVFFDDFVIWRRLTIGRHPLPRPSHGETARFVSWKLFFLAWAFVIPALFHPFGYVVLFHLIAAFTLGATLGTVFQLAHCLDEADFPLAPPEEGRMAHEWAAHQVATTVDFAPNSAFLTWFCGGLNFQVEHHLFPKVCHLHYPALSRIVADVAATHGLLHRRHMTFGAALTSHFHHLERLGAA